MENSYEESFNAHWHTQRPPQPHSQKASYENVKAGAGHLHILSQTGWDVSLPSEGQETGMDYTAARQAWLGLAFPTTVKTGHAPGQRRKMGVVEETHWLFRKAAWRLSRAQPSHPKEFRLLYLLFSIAAQRLQCCVSL